MRNYIFSFILIFCVVPSVAFASMVVRSDESVSVGVDETVMGDFYGVGQLVSVSGEVVGDSMLIGGDVSMDGIVGEDAFMLAGTAKSYASVTEDLRIVGGEVTVAEDVGGDLLVIGGMVRVLSGATIAGDVLIFGGQAIIEGPVSGSVFGTVGELRIDAQVGESVDVTVDNLVLGERAVVAGSVQYTSVNELSRATQSVVDGEIIKNDPLTSENTQTAVRTLAIGFLSILFASIVLYLLFQRQTLGVVEIVITRPLRMLMLGLGVGLISLPIALLFTASVLASLVGILLASVGLSLLIVSLMMVPVVAGEYIRRNLQPKKALSPLYIALGAVALFIGMLIPLLGLIVFIGVLFMSFGALVTRLYQISG